MKDNLKILFQFLMMAVLLVSCQRMDRPTLGDYPKDAAVIPAGKLRFYVPFDNNATSLNSQFQDSLSGYPSFPVDNSITSVAGIRGKAFQGGNNGTFLKYVSANDFTSKAQSFAIAFWAKHGAFSQTEFIYSLTGNNWALASMFLLYDSNDAVKLFVDEGSTSNWFVWDGAKAIHGLYDGNWHHMAFVYDATTSGMTAYKDGVSMGTVYWANHGAVKLQAATSLRIGGAGDPSQSWMNSWSGALDQFRMYADVLSPSEVQSLYNNKK